MAETLLLSPQEIAQTTVMSGNIDIDKYLFLIENVQLTLIQPLLGTELYEKIKTDYQNNALAGLYLDLYNKFIKDILKNQTTAEYIEVCSYSVNNKGIYTHQAENEVVPERSEIETFANKYRSNADVFIKMFYKWICKNPIPEYKTHQDEVNANQDIQMMNTFYFGSSQDLNKWGELEEKLYRKDRKNNEGW